MWLGTYGTTSAGAERGAEPPGIEIIIDNEDYANGFDVEFKVFGGLEWVVGRNFKAAFRRSNVR